MRLQINYKCINNDYSQEYADEYHWGKESENNQKYHWGKSFELPEVTEVSKPDEPFKLRAELEDGTQLEKELENVYILRVRFEDGQKDYAVSNLLLKNTHEAYSKKEGVKRFYFYLNEEPKAYEVLDGVYLTEKEAGGDGFIVV
ncbi:hypothetical protein LB465_12555 [Salegentibacter sp. LM13S]|uniref:hypothetical protein n=1 Tax=Salegentibacter lacus TaxID=2873599 RepID=UPI001CCD3E43|nr:hypothetical protein [Salegentibacter lacus]MBZ9631613.1 hypothetical protein [Salegentibacter lacus]